MAQTSRGGVAGVGELLETRRDLLAVHRDEVIPRQKDLTANLEAADGPESRGHVLDRSDVLGDIFTDPPVPTSGRLHEGAVLVGDRQRQSIDLGLDDEAKDLPVKLK